MTPVGCREERSMRSPGCQRGSDRDGGRDGMAGMLVLLPIPRTGRRLVQRDVNVRATIGGRVHADH